MLKRLFPQKTTNPFSPAFDKFIQSMKIGYEEWHDGIGYDLQALNQLNQEELEQIETILISRNNRDWRDVDALAEILSEKAIESLKSALKSGNYEVRIRATQKLARKRIIDEKEIETVLVETIPFVSIFNGQTFALRLAEEYPTPAVKRILLWATLYGNDDIRVHAAALIYYLYNIAASSFDLDYRSFYLRFGDVDFSNRKLAYDELFNKIQVDPSWAIGVSV